MAIVNFIEKTLVCIVVFIVLVVFMLWGWVNGDIKSYIEANK